MPYETKIGWRYIYMAEGARRAKIGFVLSVLVALGGLGLSIAQDGGGGSGIGVLMICIGALSAVVCACLSIFTVFTTVAVLGVILSVGTLTIVLSVATGFQNVFRDKVLGVNAHVIVTHTNFIDYEQEEARIVKMHPDIIGSQPFIYVEMLATRGKGQISGVAIKGVIPGKVEKVLDLGKHMTAGTISSLDASADDGLPNMIIGKGLATKLAAKVGDEITVVAPLSGADIENMGQRMPTPMTQKFRVSGIFYSGFGEYDGRLVYVHLREARKLWGDPDQVLGIELKVRDVNKANEVARVIENKLPQFDDHEPDRFGFKVQDWNELNNTLFSALAFQKIILLVVLVLIIVVATFNLASALLMLVVEKTPEISILKTMGGRSGSVGIIFVFLGLCVGTIGTLLGVGIGGLIAFVLGQYGYALDPEVYLIDHLPVSMQWGEIFVIVIVTMVVCAFATLVPSIRAARLHPADGIRSD